MLSLYDLLIFMHVYSYMYMGPRGQTGHWTVGNTHMPCTSQKATWKSVLSFSFGFRNRAQVHQACVATTFTHGATLLT